MKNASYMYSMGTANKVRILAVLPAAFGVYIIGATLAAYWRFFLKGDPDILWFLPLTLPMPIFGGYCIFVAYRTWSKVSIENVARVSLVAAIVLTFVVLGLLGSLRANMPEASKLKLASLASPLVIAAGGILYLICKRFLLKCLELPQTIDWTRREKTAKQFFGLLAFFSFAPLCSVGLELLPKWLFPAVVAATTIAFVIYKVGVRVALRNKPTDAEPEPPAGPVESNQ